MKEWKCVQVKHHEDVAETIQEHEEAGWILHTYNTAQLDDAVIRHYLLFYHEED
jgi:hypothetical protein